MSIGTNLSPGQLTCLNSVIGVQAQLTSSANSDASTASTDSSSATTLGSSTGYNDPIASALVAAAALAFSNAATAKAAAAAAMQDYIDKATNESNIRG